MRPLRAALAAASALLAVPACASTGRASSSEASSSEASSSEASSPVTVATTTGGAPTGSVPGEPAELERLIDGDSMELRIGGGVVEVRLLGINAPELRTVGGETSCNGREARAAMESVLAGGDLRFDGTENDRFGRLLGHLYTGGRAVDGAMVTQGWAIALWSAADPPLTAAMEEAATAGVGLWGTTCGAPAAVVEIGDVQPDPKGRDEEHLNDEWIEIVNPSPTPVDLTGWSVADETTSNRFELSALVLKAGATVRIHTGSGSDTATDVHLDQRDPVWSNSGETVLVADPSGVIVAHRFLEG